MKTKFKINEEVIYKGRKWIVIRIIINKCGINYQIENLLTKNKISYVKKEKEVLKCKKTK